MLLNFKEKKLQSISKLFLLIIVVILLVLNFIDSQSLKNDYDFLYGNDRIRNYEIYFNLIIGFLIAFLLTNSFFEEKYAFQFSNFLISLAISIFTITILLLFTDKLNFYSKLDFILKRKVEVEKRSSFLEDGDTRTYQYLIDKDTLYFSNHQKYGNMDKLEHKEILNGEIYKTFFSKEYYIKY